jgi:hypothetical protein
MADEARRALLHGPGPTIGGPRSGSCSKAVSLGADHDVTVSAVS